MNSPIRMNLNRWQSITLAAIFAGAVIFLLKYLGDLIKHPLLIASYAASLSLVFAVTHSPFVRTKNLFFGYLIGAIAGLALFHIWGSNIWTLSIAVAIALFVMEATHTLHPPAVAVPIIVITDHAQWSFLWAPLGGGVGIILICAYLHRKFIKRFPIHMA